MRRSDRLPVPIRGAGGGGEGHTPVEDKDTLRSIAYAEILDVLCEGVIEGLDTADDSVAIFRET